MENKEFFARYAQWGFPQSPIDIPKAVRINTLRTSRHACIEELRRIGCVVEETFLPEALIIHEGPTLSSTLAYLNGWIHIQELSSQLPAHILAPKKNMRALDVAAAPGNKTSHLSALMEDTGVIIACDSIHERLEKLRSNCARLGVTNMLAYQIDGTYADELMTNADVVCCDVPCSGNFTQEDWKRTFEDIQSRVPLQKKLLETSVYAAKVGGKIAYSTCSLEIEENEQIVEWALSELPVKLLPVKLSVGHAGLTPKTKDCLRIWPSQDKMGGFFVALFERIN